MVDIDEKLRKILWETVFDADSHVLLNSANEPVAIKQIKQVFADTGYVSVQGTYEPTVDIANSIPMTEEQKEFRDSFMTGQEVIKQLNDHYWDTLSDSKELIIKHVKGALNVTD